jgi:hypothetical protein
MRRELHGIDGKFNIHVALQSATAAVIDKFLGLLADDGIARVSLSRESP